MKKRIFLLVFAIAFAAATIGGCAVANMVKNYPRMIVNGADAHVQIQYEGPPGGTQDFEVYFRTESGLDICGGNAAITVEPAIVPPATVLVDVVNSRLKFSANHKTQHAVINLSYAWNNYVYVVFPGDTTIVIPISGGCK